MNDPSPPPIYVAVAYRLGLSNNTWLFVGGWHDQATATAFSVQVAVVSGGKYGVAIYRFRGENCEMVSYHSVGNETKPRHSRHIALCQEVGQCVVRLLEGPPEKVTVAELRREVKQANEIVDMHEKLRQARR